MTNTAATLTVNDIQRAASDPRWLGFGYLGGRSFLLHSTDPEAPADPELVARVDAELIAYANTVGWTYDELFAWTNSRNGRHFADAAFSGTTFDQATRWGLLALPEAD